jgi:hypothetical protein
MNEYKWVKENKNYWYQENGQYTISADWEINYEEPSIYPAFIWRETHSFQSLMHYFKVVLRKHAKLYRDKSGKYIGQYSVIIKGAESGIPLTTELWGDPWKGFNNYVEPFYFGKKYKDDFEYNYYQEKYGEGSYSSALGRGFDDLNEAREFTERWKIKILNDHKKQLELERNIHDKYIK